MTGALETVREREIMTVRKALSEELVMRRHNAYVPCLTEPIGKELTQHLVGGLSH